MVVADFYRSTMMIAMSSPLSHRWERGPRVRAGYQSLAQRNPPPMCSWVAGRGFLLKGAGPVYCVPDLFKILPCLTSVDSPVPMISQNGSIIELEGVPADSCSRAAEQSSQPLQIEHFGTLSFCTALGIASFGGRSATAPR